MIFTEGIDLPEFASCTCLTHDKGIEAVDRYYRTFAKIAKDQELGIILETPTWRCSQAWGDKLGWDANKVEEINRQAVDVLEKVRSEYPDVPIIISGYVGPADDGYVVPEVKMTPEEAEKYHSVQINVFKDTSVDMIETATFNYVDEAIGCVNAAKKAGLQISFAFTCETDGTIPEGITFKEAVQRVDEATDSYPCYYMINCSHPDHLESIWDGGDWLKRVRGINTNASRKTHKELETSTELDSGNPEELGGLMAELTVKLPNLNVIGGCCGTDERHIEQMAIQSKAKLTAK
jgi:homocysteine S-methyltransferase